MNQTDITGSEASPPSDSLPAHRGSLLLPALLLLLVGGLIGYLIGRQSVNQPTAEPTAAEPAANAVAEPVLATTSPNNTTSPAFSSAPVGPTPASITPETLRTMGDPNAPVTLVEFSDYQCPFCLRHFQETMPQLKTEYIDTGRVYYVFKDFPIASLHPVAARIAEAARCAGEMGGSEGYWQAHDSFFNNRDQLTDLPQPDLDEMLVRLTSEVAIDEAAMRECVASGRYTAAVNADLAEGGQLGVTGTPGFFINGYPLSGAQPYAVFQEAIALAEEGRLAEAFQPSTAPTSVPAPDGQPITVPLSDEPALGSADAPITIVEYSDFQCPFCLRHFEQTLPQLQPYIDAGQVRYVFKDFPIHNIHPQAQKAHESARCARELGGGEAFWTMHDLLFANQEQWADNSNHVEVFKSLVGEIGLDQTAFDECLDSGRYAEAVNAQVAEGLDLAIQGTPTFFINGQRLVGAQPFATFQQIIESLLAGE